MSGPPAGLSYVALFARFLRFGLLAFGGPVAQIAMIRRELVEEEGWIDGAGFNRLLAVLQALPGPEAHELCVHLGIRAKGRLGGLLAGLGFMLPGFLLMMLLAWAYTRLAPFSGWLSAAFLGVQVAVLAVILRAVERIGRHILTDGWLWAVAIAAAAATLAGVSFWIVLVAGGASYGLERQRRWFGLAGAVGVAAVLAFFTAGLTSPAVPLGGSNGDPTALGLFVAGLKGGLLTFGGAYTAIPFVRNDTVGRGWMSDAQFLDGLALSGVVPAPLVIFVTFVGWICGGPVGALAITAGMFLPAFAFSMLFYERLEAVAEREALHDVLAGVAAAVVGLIAVTLVDLAAATAERLPSWASAVALFAVALAILLAWKSKLATPAVLLVGAAAGVAFF